MVEYGYIENGYLISKILEPETENFRDEETGSLVAGRLNAAIINQSDSLSVIRQSLIYHQQTAANTGISARELTEIRTTLNTIKNSMGNNALLSQGIS